jgi:hypothetical protein
MQADRGPNPVELSKRRPDRHLFSDSEAYDLNAYNVFRQVFHAGFEHHQSPALLNNLTGKNTRDGRSIALRVFSNL